MSENVALDPERQKKAKQYARISRRLWLLNLVLSGVYTLAWLLFGWSAALRDGLVTRSSLLANPWILVPAFLLVFGGIYFLIDLPLSYYSGFVLPHRFELSTQTIGGWIGDAIGYDFAHKRLVEEWAAFEREREQRLGRAADDAPRPAPAPSNDPIAGRG